MSHDNDDLDRLGGYDAITAVASDLLLRLQADPQLGRNWRIVEKMAFLCAMFHHWHWLSQDLNLRNNGNFSQRVRSMTYRLSATALADALKHLCKYGDTDVYPHLPSRRDATLTSSVNVESGPDRQKKQHKRRIDRIK